MTSLSDDSFALLVKNQLANIETRLIQAAEGDSPLVTEMSQHIVNAGGKRFRPMLLVLAAHATATQKLDIERLEKAAVVVELTHVASLYHDDVMDDADIRRGVPSANNQYGNSLAILVGDYQFSQASSIVAELGVDFVKLQADTFARLVQGQIAEFVGPGEANPLEHYLKVINGKTASLISTSAVFGGMVADASREDLSALREFGEEIGMAFQISDDIIDITSDETGKTPGTDLREGVDTLPTLFLRASKDPKDQELVKLIDSGLDSDADLEEAVIQLRTNSVIEKAREEVARRAEVARGYIEHFEQTAAKDSMLGLCDHVVTRTN